MSLSDVPLHMLHEIGSGSHERCCYGSSPPHVLREAREVGGAWLSLEALLAKSFLCVLKRLEPRRHVSDTAGMGLQSVPLSLDLVSRKRSSRADGVFGEQ